MNRFLSGKKELHTFRFHFPVFMEIDPSTSIPGMSHILSIFPCLETGLKEVSNQLQPSDINRLLHLGLSRCNG